jgi:flagellin-like hook-associated protein FlgL
MLSINTNLSSLIVQNNLTQSTNALNTAIERMTTGYKLNHASDNAAGYSIAEDMSSKLSSYMVAQDNISAGMDLIATAQDTISLMQSHGERIHALITQAHNGTYGASSLSAIQSEVNARLAEITRLYNTTEYNGIDLLKIPLPDWAEEVKESAGNVTAKAEYNGFIDDPVTYSDSEVEAMTALSVQPVGSTISSGTYKISSKEELAQLATMTNNGKITGGTFVLASDIDLGGEEWTAIGTSSKQFKGIFDGNGHVIKNL